MSVDVKRKLKIKAGAVNRLAKEFENYKKETTTQGEKIKKLKESNADAYDVKKQEEVLAESNAMIKDSRSRLDAALQDLNQHVETAGLPESDEDLVAAKAAGAKAHAVLQTA